MVADLRWRDHHHQLHCSTGSLGLRAWATAQRKVSRTHGSWRVLVRSQSASCSESPSRRANSSTVRTPSRFRFASMLVPTPRRSRRWRVAPAGRLSRARRFRAPDRCVEVFCSAVDGAMHDPPHDCPMFHRGVRSGAKRFLTVASQKALRRRKELSFTTERKSRLPKSSTFARALSSVPDFFTASYARSSGVLSDRGLGQCTIWQRIVLQFFNRW